MKSLLFHFAMIGIPSAIGAFAYLIVSKNRPGYSLLKWELGLLFVFTLFLSFIGGILLFFGALIPISMLGCLSILGAWAHRKLEGEKITGKMESWVLLLSASIFSMYLGTAGAISLQDPVNKFFSPGYAGTLLTIYWLLLAISPTLTPYVLWMGQSMKLRPGMDTHFEN